MKESYIRFRCTEEEKAIIEAMAISDKEATSMSDYILNLVKKDAEMYEIIEIFAVKMDVSSGNEKERKRCGKYLFKEGRASKDVYKKVEEVRNTFWEKSAEEPVVYVSSDSRMLVTDMISKECWLK